MKILEKKSIDKERALEKKRAIEEGARLAEKVDKLRELSASEESKLKSFRESSLIEVRNDIDTTLRQKINLETEIEKLQEERKRLTKPLTEEWEKLNEDIAIFEAQKDELVSKQKELREIERLTANEIVQIRSEKAQLEEQKKLVSNLVREAQITSSDAHEIMLDAQEKERETNYRIGKKERAMTKREEQVALHERDVRNSFDILKQKEIELNNRDRAITDKYETLQRTITRLHEQR